MSALLGDNRPNQPPPNAGQRGMTADNWRQPPQQGHSNDVIVMSARIDGGFNGRNGIPTAGNQPVIGNGGMSAGPPNIDGAASPAWRRGEMVRKVLG